MKYCTGIFILYAYTCGFLFGASLPALKNPQDYDSEYELDMLQNYFASDWIWEWLSAENGIRITGGSLNIRHIYHDRYVKLRFPIIKNRMWFRYNHTIRQVIEDEWQFDEIEIEYSPVKNLFLSFLGDPTYHKSEIDIGWAVRYGNREDNSIQLKYLLIDYDSNYAYHNKSTNEGFERFYRDFPYEWRMKLVSAVYPVKIWIEGRHRSNWTRRDLDLVNPNNNAIRFGREYMLEGEIRWDREVFSPSIDFFGRFTRKGISYEVPRSDGDHTRWEKRVFVRPQVVIYFSERFELDSGCELVKHDGEDVYPGTAFLYKYFDNRNIIPFIIGRLHIKGPLYGEAGYMHGTIDERKIEGNLSYRRIKRENRLRLAADFKFITGTRLKIITGWDLDREDWGKFALFDGGYIQFQTSF